MVEAGAAMITVHGRTRVQGFSGKSDRGIIRKTREALPAHIPVVGNGDVITVDDYFRMREETGCDAVMIGRGALGNPWLFRGIQERLRGERVTEPTVGDRMRMFCRHVDLIAAHTPQKRLVHELRKAVAWYTKGLRDSAHVRERAFNVMDPTQVREIAIAYFSSLDQEKNAPREIVSLVDKFGRQVA
jgi:tRNA-dihydrouridine synthase